MRIEFKNSSASKFDRYGRGGRKIEDKTGYPCAYALPTYDTVVFLGHATGDRTECGRYVDKDMFRVEITVDEIRAAAEELRKVGFEI